MPMTNWPANGPITTAGRCYANLAFPPPLPGDRARDHRTESPANDRAHLVAPLAVSHLMWAPHRGSITDIRNDSRACE